MAAILTVEFALSTYDTANPRFNSPNCTWTTCHILTTLRSWQISRKGRSCPIGTPFCRRSSNGFPSELLRRIRCTPKKKSGASLQKSSSPRRLHVDSLPPAMPCLRRVPAEAARRTLSNFCHAAQEHTEQRRIIICARAEPDGPTVGM